MLDDLFVIECFGCFEGISVCWKDVYMDILIFVSECVYFLFGEIVKYGCDGYSIGCVCVGLYCIECVCWIWIDSEDGVC